MTRSDLDDLVSVHGKPSFEPIPSMMVGPTEIRRDTENCTNCGEYFGTGLSMSHPICIKCEAPWPRSKEREGPKCHELWYRGPDASKPHVVKSCFDAQVIHHPDGEPENAERTNLATFMATFRFLEEAPSR